MEMLEIEKKSILPNIIFTLFICIALIFSIGILLFSTMFTLCQVDGASMNPTFETKQYVLLSKYNFGYKNGNVIVFGKDNSLYIKRIIAKGGDTIMFSKTDGKVNVLVNDVVLEEEYINGAMTDSWIYQSALIGLDEPLYIPQGKYFVMGDNRNNSRDSRFANMGLVDESEILGGYSMTIQDGTFMDFMATLFFGKGRGEA